MALEIIATTLIVGLAGYFLYKNIKKKGASGCDCGSCSSKCPSYKKEDK